MSNTEKLELIEDLFELRKRLLWLAQHNDESTYCFGQRVLKLAKAYKIAGKIAQLELIEVTESLKDREHLAIACFVQNLRKDVRRYMCQPEIYNSLKQAVNHAEQVSNNLRDLIIIE